LGEGEGVLDLERDYESRLLQKGREDDYWYLKKGRRGSLPGDIWI
jgi:hypothetical protein